jgi:poly(A) polymerase
MKRAYATEIVRKLRENGHETYFVGGCVRDMEMGVEPSDYDVATAARPDEVMALFPRTEPIGVQFVRRRAPPHPSDVHRAA